MQRIAQAVGLAEPPGPTLQEQIEQLQQQMNNMQLLLNRFVTESRDLRLPNKETIKLREELYETRAGAVSKTIDHLETIDDKNLMPSVDDAVAFLHVRSIGKIVDNTYIAFCGAILREYFTKRCKITTHEERIIADAAIQVHLVQINPKLKYDLDVIQAYNDNISFIKRCTLRIFNIVIEFPLFTKNLALNVSRPVYTYLQCKPLSTSLIIAASPVLAYAAVLCTVRLSKILTNSFIIPSLMKPVSLVYSIVTYPLRYLNTSLTYLENNVFSSGSKPSVNPGLMKSISTAWITPLKETCTNACLMTYNKVAQLEATYVLSQSSRKLEQVATSLLALSKPVIPHSISLMDASLNLSKKSLNIAQNSVKELMTTLQPKLTNIVENGSTILNSTIKYSTPILQSKCSNLYTISTSHVMPIIQNFCCSAKEQYPIVLMDVMGRSIKLGERGCQVTWTLASEIAFSTTTYCEAALPTLVSSAKSSLMEMIALSLRTYHWIRPPLKPPSDDIIWMLLYLPV
nr:hypothetical protein [Dipteran tombus-related virus]